MHIYKYLVPHSLSHTVYYQAAIQSYIPYVWDTIRLHVFLRDILLKGSDVELGLIKDVFKVRNRHPTVWPFYLHHAVGILCKTQKCVAPTTPILGSS